MAKGLILIGKVVKPHGLKGEICMACYADSLFVLDGVQRVYLQPEGRKAKPFNLLSWRPHTNKALLMLENITGRDMVSKWKGADVLVRQKDLPELEEDEVYIQDIIDFNIMLDSGQLVGVLEEVHDYSGSEVWSIRGAADEEILLPAVPEFVLDIDMDKQQIIIDPPPGLMDLYFKQEN